MKYFSTLFTLIMLPLLMDAAGVNRAVFDLLDLGRPGLEAVAKAHAAGNDDAAAIALLDYYRTRTGVANPAIDLDSITISADEQKWADEALEHRFFSHYGYQPSFFYGDDIDWTFWPVRDNELRWQLHRHKWFTPMGKAYRLSGDEKYAREWAAQYVDWIRKNPLEPIDRTLYELTDSVSARSAAENVRFAWRALETSHRLQDQINQFTLFLDSPEFMPGFLTEFLVNYHRHAGHVMANYSEAGNHLLFEAQRVMCAGAFFPEFKDAPAWRRSGMDILNREIAKQVYPDGGQFELDPHYHLACIEIFCKALAMADANGLRDEFPPSYTDTIERMITFYYNICFPDYTNPCFSDARRGSRVGELANYRTWATLFPANEHIRFFATEGREGAAPQNLSRGFRDTGFFTLRNGWDGSSTVMVVKAGPKGEWHAQPDNGTFELWVNGRNLFPDSGSYVYEGSEDVIKLRKWFRQSAVHNTLTLDNRDFDHTESRTVDWDISDADMQRLVTENQNYDSLTHRRTILFVDQKYFVIVDEAYGDATGTINIHYNLCEGPVAVDRDKLCISTTENIPAGAAILCRADRDISIAEHTGWYSTAYRQRTGRPAYSFDIQKNDKAPVRAVSVIYPTTQDTGEISAELNGSELCVTVNNTTRRIPLNK